MRRRYLLAAAALTPAGALLARRAWAAYVRTHADSMLDELDLPWRYLGPLGRFQSSRLGLAAHVLRGRPLGYRLRIENGTVMVDESDTYLHSCTVINSPTAVQGEAFFPPPPRFREDW